MDERAFDKVRLLPRYEPEIFAQRAVLRFQRDTSELEAARLFVAALIAFLIGALVAAAGFLAGFSLA